MADLIVYVDQSTVHDGRLNELEPAMTELTAYVEANEPDILSYDVYFDPAGDRMTVVHLHDGSETLAYHMDVAGHKFGPIGEYITLESIDVYGRPSDEIVAALEEKAATLGSATVTIHERHAGVEHLTAD